MKSLVITLLGAIALALLAHVKSTESVPSVLFIWSEVVGS